MRSTVATSRLDGWRQQRPGASDRELIVRGISEIHDELQLTPPINLDVVASRLGIAEVRSTLRLPVAGCVLCTNGQIEVVVRASDPPGRQRFTICHECVHPFFPEFATSSKRYCDPGRSSSDGSDLESLCDIGAAELLLPRRQFQQDLRGLDFGLPSVEFLAERYEASLEATGSRVASLSPRGVGFMLFEVAQSKRQRGTSAAPKLRLQWSRSNGALPFIPKHKSVSSASAFGLALAGGEVLLVTDLAELTRKPLQVEVSAKAYNYVRDGQEVQRVLALVRRH